MQDTNSSRVAAIAVRTAVDGPMREIDSAVATVDGGIDGDVKCAPDRGMTFLSSQQWRQVVRELGTELAWHTRRANVLVSAPELSGWIGKTVRIGDGEGGAKVLTLSDDKRSMNIPISHEQLIVLCDALKTLVVKSDWNLNLLYPWENAAETDSAAPPAADGAPTRH